MKQPNKVYLFNELDPGDRFYFAADSKKHVWQVTYKNLEYTTIERPGKSENKREFNKRVVFLRRVN
nr:hypothetical protein [uncultured Carboxylicivirga sp.]